jgi:hypothetical protein
MADRPRNYQVAITSQIYKVMSKVQLFQEDLSKVEELLSEVLKKHKVENGVVIKVSEGTIRTFINIDDIMD